MQELARQLASVKGDSLREYWRGYWKKRVKSSRTTDTVVSTDTVESTDTIAVVDTVESDDALFRASIVENEKCNIALDSNRSALAQTTYNLEESLSTLEKCEDSRKWYGIGGFGLGYLLRIATP